jgi:hypothetical protein
MKTSNYTTAGKDPGAVSISVTAPAWFAGPTYPALVPPPKLVRAYKAGEVTEVEYVTWYDMERLRLLDAGRVADDLRELAAPHEPILLCWCGRDAFCHRRLVAAWIEKNLGIVVPEMEVTR